MKAKNSPTLLGYYQPSDHWRKRRKAVIDSFVAGAASAGLMFSELSTPPRYQRRANADLIAIGNDIRRVIEAHGEAQETTATRQA